MARHPSKVDQLPEEARDLIGRLRRQGRTLDEIMAKLTELDLDPEAMPSRSGLGRHLKEIAALTEEAHRQRMIAEAMVDRGLMMDEGRTAKVNISLAHGLLSRLMFTSEGQMATLDPEEAMFVAKSVQALVSAAKNDTERELKVREQMAKEAAKVAAKVAREHGMTREEVDIFTREILGLAK